MAETDVNTALTLSCQSRLPEALDFLRRMVEVNSFTENATGVNRLAGMIAEEFAPLGFTAARVPSDNFRHGDHLVLRCAGPENGPVIALVSHLDTVFTPAEEAQNHFSWRVEGTRIYGPGTNDIKGGTALIFLLLAALREVAPAEFAATTWVILLNACEEVISADFGRLCREVLPPETLACLVFEADGGEGNDFSLVTARKGRATFRVDVAGRGAHAGAAHAKGANAITCLARVVAGLDGITDYAAGLTVNVGAIRGGTVTNRVPHEASAELEMRAFDPVVYAGAKRTILAAGVAGAVADGCRVEVQVSDETVPWPENAGSDRLFAVWAAAGKELGLAVRSEQRGGLSDGNVLWDAFPTLDGLGPRGENSHCSEHEPAVGKEQEWVDAASVVPKTVLNAKAVLSLLKNNTSGGPL